MPSRLRSLLLTNVRLLPLTGPGTDAAQRNPEPVDVRIVNGVVTHTGRGLAAHRTPVFDGGGCWAMPGLWDQHVHALQAGADRGRLDLADTAGPEAVCARVAARVSTLSDPKAIISASGYRSALWPRAATVAELDAASYGHPVIAISADCHGGWLNSAALELLGLPPRESPLVENDWFPVMARLRDLPGVRFSAEWGLRELVADLHARGVVGIVDMEHAAAYRDWHARVDAGLDTMRVRASVYPEALDRAVSARRRTHDPITGLVTMGPLKIISDGSLNTRTAWCCEPYAGDTSVDRFGARNYTFEELHDLATRANEAGLEVALHAIGDAAVGQALDVFARTGARGAIEHAQLVRWLDVPRMAQLGVRASVQPAHLLDDRDVTDACWPSGAQRSFPLRSMLRAGVDVRMGSDAPVAPPDPWLAMAAAVHRSADDREAWHPEQSLTATQALAASTDGYGTIGRGHPGDIILLDADPRGPAGEKPRAAATRLRATRPVVTIVAGRVVHTR